MQQQSMVVVVQKEVDGVEMGVLADATPYLSGRGLAKLCGTTPSTIYERTAEWVAGDRDGKFGRHLRAAEFDEVLYVPVVHKGSHAYAYSDAVSLLFLGYYAIEVGNEIALKNYRLLARKTLRDFIYAATGYNPHREVSDRWRQLHDRMLLNLVPAGYFNVFTEMTPIVMASIRAGLIVDDKVVPDISVGLAWSTHWEENRFDEEYGARKKHDHNYPLYFAQAASNPQPAWCYPIKALGEFHRWLPEEYLPEKFPTYLVGQVTKGSLAEGTARHVLTAVGQPAGALVLPARRKPRALPAPGKTRSLPAKLPATTKRK